MNLYVPLGELEFFLQNIKDFGKYDDYKLDGERLGKKKIVFNGISNKSQFIADIFAITPNHCMFEYEKNIRKNDFILCAGSIHIDNFLYFQEIGATPTLLTKLGNHVRFNAWIHHSLLEKARTDKFIETFSTMMGVIDEKPYFMIDAMDINKILPIISKNTNIYIIKKNRIFVNLSLRFFCRHYPELAPWVNHLEIVDKGDF